MRRLGGFPTSPATKEPIIDNYLTVRNIREQMAGSYGEAVAGSLGMLGLYVFSSWSMVFNVVVVGWRLLALHVAVEHGALSGLVGKPLARARTKRNFTRYAQA